jgi:hypothetical protein
MTLRERIEAFSELGEILRNSLGGINKKYSVALANLINGQQHKNPWFTPENVRLAVKAIADELTFDHLTTWTNSYPALDSVRNPLNVGVIMAGNIPLAGFHDFISVLISGNNILAKTSTKDAELIVYIADLLCSINPKFEKSVSFTDPILSGFDAVIASGSDNTSRYFEYYFGKYPSIIRKNRNSIAIIEGNEQAAELEALGTDIFSYFGMGCRNVSKIYVPENHNFETMISNWSLFSDIISHNKYVNNYDFNKAVYLVNRENFIDTGYMLLKKNSALSSPVAVLYYEHYNSPDYLTQQIGIMKERIQCVVGRSHIPFGSSQLPYLWDYADGIDTIDFLLKKNITGIS